MTLVGTALKLGEKMKICPRILTFFIKPQNWLFHVVVLQKTAKKWTKVKNARAGRAKLLFLPTKGPVIRVTFSFNLSRNIVETLCCSYYRARDQLFSKQNIVLQVEASCCEK